jgi:hypothetical protein
MDRYVIFNVLARDRIAAKNKCHFHFHIRKEVVGKDTGCLEQRTCVANFFNKLLDWRSNPCVKLY